MVDSYANKDQAAAHAKFSSSCSEEAICDSISFLKSQYTSPLLTAADIGCGTGKNTRMLTTYFQNVIGFDISDAQLDQAKMFTNNPTNIKYKKSIAEILPLEDSSVQMVTAFGALHFFDFDKFFPEVKRVLTDKGVFMVWSQSGYKLIASDKEKTEKLQHLHHTFLVETLKPYWDKRLFIVVESFKSVSFPFPDIERKEYTQSSTTTIRKRIASYASMCPFQEMREDNPISLDSHVQNLIKSSEEILGDLDSEITLQMTSILILCRNCK